LKRAELGSVEAFDLGLLGLRGKVSLSWFNEILSGEDFFVAAAGWLARVLLRFSFGLLSARSF
jgi:hypothetical protein